LFGLNIALHRLDRTVFRQDSCDCPCAALAGHAHSVLIYNWGLHFIINARPE